MVEACWIDLGSMEYGQAWDLQRRVGRMVGAGALPDTILVVEHPPVYTVGRSARGSLANLLWDEERRAREGIQLYMVDRGGDITYHGPGQLVGYPILDLTRHGQDLNRYLRQLEAALVDALAEFHIEAGQLAGHTGVWVGHEKVAAIGVKASNWITEHGFALNVNPNLNHFAGIIPCGIADKGVTSMARILGRDVAVSDVLPSVQDSLKQIFGFRYQCYDRSFLFDLDAADLA
jgi:lipoate-protein ligase B